MKKQYKLTALALTACLLTGCGAGKTSALENTTAEKQPTEPVAETSAETFTETASATTEVPQETTAQENPIAPKEIAIDFTGVSEFHPEGTAAQPYSLEILSETYNNITFADEWYNASEDISLPMIGENWDCFYDENYTYQWDYTYQWEDGKLSIFDGENCLYVLEYPTDKWYVNGNNACLENGIFYGASVMNGYAQPDSCFMFAYDLENDKLLWRSADQTYNSMNFVVKGDVILCGYGFTAEPDYLYQINRNTGEVIDRLSLKKAPDLIIEQDGKLYVQLQLCDRDGCTERILSGRYGLGNSDNRKRGVNSRQNEKNREALIAVLTVCLIGVLVTVVIIAAVDLYRKHTYTAEIDPSEYKIIKIEKSTTTSYSAATETVDTDSIYVVTVEYQVDGVTYTDTLDMLTGTELAKTLYGRYQTDSNPEEVLGKLYYSPKKPSHIGRYGDDSIFVK